MSKHKVDAKTFYQARRRRRRVLTFVRMVRYGVNNFSRNAWLTIAATAVMTITLLIIFTTVVARQVLLDTVATIQDKVDMSVYLKSDSSESQVAEAAQAVRGLATVKEVSSISPEQARAGFIEANKSEGSTLNSLNNSDPEFPWRLRVKLNDINATEELSKFVDTSSIMQRLVDTSMPPSYAGPQRTAIERIAGWVQFADKAGLGAGIVFVAISSLIIFNTIRMAIFNRREEIQMMKLIGAERAFIRGPFVVEAIMYGFIAALLATTIGVLAVVGAQDTLMTNGIAISSVARMLVIYSPFVLLAMIVIGGLIGIVSSLLATRRYLKL